MSGKTSETGGKQKDAQTFKNDSILWTPKVAKRLRLQDLVAHNMYEFRFINENMEPVSMLKILSRVDFDTVPKCVW